MRRTVHVEGPRPAADVWDRYARPARWPEWSPQIRSVDCPGEFLAPDATGVVHGPAGLRVHFRIIDVTGSRSWSWRVSALGVPLALHHTVEATARGTRTGLTIEGPAPVVLAYLPVALWALRRLVN